MRPGKKICILTVALLTGAVSNLFSAGPISFALTEIPVFQYDSSAGSTLLQMDYASHIIRNPEGWNNKDHRRKIYRVDIVYTRYPLHKKDWITNYDTLLNRRVQAICGLENNIKPADITWNIVLQTSCRTEDEARTLFHGAVLWYNESPAPQTPTLKKSPLPVVAIGAGTVPPASTDIWELTNGTYLFPDSTVFKVLERNDDWENLLIVSDWTSSMYQYGAQALLWHQMNIEKNNISKFVFFNDGDDKKVKPMGKTGGIYFAGPDNINTVRKVMERVQHRGTGGDAPENDIEALLKAIHKVSSFGEVILIADNHAPVKDIKLLKELNVPVRIILCGCRRGETILHDYLQVASYTHGSIHTMEEDIWNLSEIKEGERVTILDIPYQRTHGRIVKTKYIRSVKAQL